MSDVLKFEYFNIKEFFFESLFIRKFEIKYLNLKHFESLLLFCRVVLINESFFWDFTLHRDQRSLRLSMTRTYLSTLMAAAAATCM